VLIKENLKFPFLEEPVDKLDKLTAGKVIDILTG
jgi:hypothetical protein